MTQAFNLSQLANKVNSSGLLDASTGLTGIAPIANGGTGRSTLTTNYVLLGNGTSALQMIAPSTSGNYLTSNGTTWTSAAPSGGVTSAVSGNGVAVSAATGAVTFSASAPTANSVGSYCWGYMWTNDQIGVTMGSNYAAGSSNYQVRAAAGSTYVSCDVGRITQVDTNMLSGTWKAMGGTFSGATYTNFYGYSAVFVRVS